jgi:hypothetical protein
MSIENRGVRTVENGMGTPADGGCRLNICSGCLDGLGDSMWYAHRRETFTFYSPLERPISPH